MNLVYLGLISIALAGCQGHHVGISESKNAPKESEKPSPNEDNPPNNPCILHEEGDTLYFICTNGVGKINLKTPEQKDGKGS